MRVSWDGPAGASYAAAIRWLTQSGSGLPAAQKVSAIRQAVKSLRSDPHRYPPLDEPPGCPAELGYRKISVVGHVIVFEILRDDTGSYVLITGYFAPGQFTLSPKNEPIK